jgi:hypothetical protein
MPKGIPAHGHRYISFSDLDKKAQKIVESIAEFQEKSKTRSDYARLVDFDLLQKVKKQLIDLISLDKS